MSITRQQLYAAGEPLGDSVTQRVAGVTTYGTGGGGGGGAKYKNLEGLYKEQAESARLLRQQAEKYLPGFTDDYAGRVQDVTSSDYAQRQATEAQSDLTAAAANERAAVQREMTSQGVNPNDARFAGGLRRAATENASRTAAGVNAARNDAKRYQLAVAQDAVGTFSGQSNTAAQQLSAATSGLSGVYGQQQAARNAQRQQQSDNVGNAVAGGMMLYSLKDGGRVKGLRAWPARP